MHLKFLHKRNHTLRTLTSASFTQHDFENHPFPHVRPHMNMPRLVCPFLYHLLMEICFSPFLAVVNRAAMNIHE